jgi:hypothetical protein
MTRACGSCTQCCKTMKVEAPSLHKAKDVWCPHCEIGRGCTIYAERPQPCRDFECLWLRGSGSEAMRPDRCKVVLTAPEPIPEMPRGVLLAHVDPTRPEAWRNGEMGRWLEQGVNQGVTVMLILGATHRKVITQDAHIAGWLERALKSHPDLFQVR